MTVTVNTGNNKGRPRRSAGPWSIDEVAALTGLPSRTIRQYRTDGVLQPPRKVGRTGVYDQGHLDRLQLISRLQGRGYSLAGMRDLFDSWERGASLEQVIVGSGIDDAPVLISAEELSERIPVMSSPLVRERAMAVGLLSTAAAEMWCVRAPALLDLAEDALSSGASLDEVFTAVAEMIDGARRQAAALVGMLGRVAEELPPGELDRLARRGRVNAARSASALLVDALGKALADRPDLVSAAAVGRPPQRIRRSTAKR